MTRTGALLWKEWRDHRTAVAVLAALVPLVSWPVQRWVFKYAEPEWTWLFVVPLCVGFAVAVVAADLFAMDLATSRMTAFAALPVPVRRHFTVRTAFLAAVALAFAAWTVAMNTALVGIWGKPGAAAALVGSFDPAFTGMSVSAAAIAGVLVLSGLGIGGFRAVIGGVLLAGIGYAATLYAASLVLPAVQYWNPQPARDPLTWLAVAGVLLVAAYVGFVTGRAHSTGRRRGALLVAAVLVATLGVPSGAAAWHAYRIWQIVPTDPELCLPNNIPVSPDGSYVAVWAQKPQGTIRSWVLRVEDGALFDWPQRNEVIGGWTTDGLAWVGPMNYQDSDRDFGRFVHPETGATVSRAPSDGAAMAKRLATGWGAGPRWAQWLRYEVTPARPASKGVAPTCTWRLWEKDGAGERTIEGRQGVAATPRVGEVLIVTPDAKLALVRLAGGEPTIVWDDATGIGSWTSGSPDGRYFTLSTSKGWIVLDSTTWTCVAGPFEPTSAYWCPGSDAAPTLAVAEAKTENVKRLLEFPSGREVVPDASLGVLCGYGSVHRLPDGSFVARSGTNRLLHLDADGKFIRRLFPPEE
jgi:hypothetical protein